MSFFYQIHIFLFFFFFFSSRRRHTRLTCDWSSDVCSSDLAGIRCGIRFAARCPTRERNGGPPRRDKLQAVFPQSLSPEIEHVFYRARFSDVPARSRWPLCRVLS